MNKKILFFNINLCVSNLYFALIEGKNKLLKSNVKKV